MQRYKIKELCWDEAMLGQPTSIRPQSQPYRLPCGFPFNCFQVEHPVTEMFTGIDIIKEQIKITSGEKLEYKQEDIKFTGHSMECRINAENPDKKFMPCPGKIIGLHLPGGNGVRVDTAIYSGYTVPGCYDSMIAKVIVHGKNREESISKMKSALGEFIVDGIITNIDFLYKILENKNFIENNYDTSFIQKEFNI